MKNDISDSINKTIIEAKEKHLISTKDISDGHNSEEDLERLKSLCKNNKYRK